MKVNWLIGYKHLNQQISTHLRLEDEVTHLISGVDHEQMTFRVGCSSVQVQGDRAPRSFECATLVVYVVVMIES